MYVISLVRNRYTYTAKIALQHYNYCERFWVLKINNYYTFELIIQFIN